jgi:hypothetical protein
MQIVKNSRRRGEGGRSLEGGGAVATRSARQNVDLTHQCSKSRSSDQCNRIERPLHPHRGDRVLFNTVN